jgi:hypothetical protein
MRYKLLIRTAAQSLMCCLLIGCSTMARRASQTECTVPDSQSNRSEVVRLVASVAGTSGMREDTQNQLARLNSEPVHGGYSLLAAYSATNYAPPELLTLWATADKGLVTASLHQAKRHPARTESYFEIEERLTNAFRQFFGQSVSVRSRDYVVP